MPSMIPIPEKFMADPAWQADAYGWSLAGQLEEDHGAAWIDRQRAIHQTHRLGLGTMEPGVGVRPSVRL